MDSFLMRMNDVFLSIPGLYLLLLVIVIYGVRSGPSSRSSASRAGSASHD